MKNSLLKDLWHLQDGFTEIPICDRPNLWRNKAYLTKYKDLINNNRPVNPQGFRSHYDYLDLPQDTFKIGFFGCSNTEGIGLCEEHLWTDIFLKEFKIRYNKNAIGLNFGKAGCSNGYIAWNIEKALEEIDLDLICVQFAHTVRRTFAKPNKSVYQKVPIGLALPFINIIFSNTWGPFVNGDVNKKEFKILQDWMCSEENNCLDTLNQLKIIKYTLQKKKIPFIINKVQEGDRDIQLRHKINILPRLSDDIRQNTDLIADLWALDWNGNNGHQGLLWQKSIAEIYLKQYEESIIKRVMG